MPDRCVDASVALKWVLVNQPWRKKARQLLKESLAAHYTLVAPPLFHHETESAIQTLVQTGVLSVAQADASLADLEMVGVRLVTHPDLVRRARAIARQAQQHKIYDSLYASLAELRGCEFWTADTAFFNAVKSWLPFVKHLPDYP